MGAVLYIGPRKGPNLAALGSGVSRGRVQSRIGKLLREGVTWLMLRSQNILNLENPTNKMN